MEIQDYIIIVSAFLLASGLGFAIHQYNQNTSQRGFTADTDLRVNSSNQVAKTVFDNHSLELRYEDTDKAKFYFYFEDKRGVERIKDLKQDGTLQTTTKIRSFGNQTYFLYLRYQDSPNQSEDGFMELYRIEET